MNIGFWKVYVLGSEMGVSQKEKNSINDEIWDWSTYFQQPSNLTATQANLLEDLFSANALFLGIDFLRLNSATHCHWFLWPLWLLDLSRDQNQIRYVFWLYVLIRLQISWGFLVLCVFSGVWSLPWNHIKVFIHCNLFIDSYLNLASVN